MHVKSMFAAVLVTSLSVSLTACGSGGDGAEADGSGPLKIGMYASLSGPASASYTRYIPAVKARIKQYEDDGGACASRGFEFADADEASSPEGSLAAAQKLVQQSKVDAILTPSPFFYAASPYLASQAKDTIAIATGAEGAQEYQDVDNNVFGVLAPQEYDADYTEPGGYYKKKGVTVMSLISDDNPSASKSLEQTRRSLEANGIKIGYFNQKVSYGTTDVGVIVQKIMDTHSDGFYAAMLPETALAVVAGLHQNGYMGTMKVTHLATGYGAGLLESEPTVQAAQGVSFSTSGWRPNELGGAAVEKMATTLKTYTDNKAGVPGWDDAMGYFEADLLLYALEKAGCDATGPDLVKAIRSDDGWDAGGLLAAKRDFGSTTMDENCSFVLTLEDHAFVPDPMASPSCGKKITN